MDRSDLEDVNHGAGGGMGGDFAGKVALVTGGASGIGRATALMLAGRGARVLVADRDLTGAEETASLAAAAGGEASAVRVDVTDDGEVRAMVEAALERWGRLDVAVNCAGIGGVRARTAEYPEDMWQRVLAVNLTGVFLAMRHEIAAMQRGGGGAIVNVASVAGVLGFPGHAAYAASKHGVIGLTRTAALEYARHGIRVNAVCPAVTHTPMAEAMVGGDAALEERLRAAIPLGRFGTPEEIAGAIVYLCSDAAGFVTGHALVLDGGLSAG